MSTLLLATASRVAPARGAEVRRLWETTETGDPLRGLERRAYVNALGDALAALEEAGVALSRRGRESSQVSTALRRPST
jgi:hypothetical protein